MVNDGLTVIGCETDRAPMPPIYGWYKWATLNTLYYFTLFNYLNHSILQQKKIKPPQLNFLNIHTTRLKFKMGPIKHHNISYIWKEVKWSMTV